MWIRPRDRLSRPHRPPWTAPLAHLRLPQPSRGLSSIFPHRRKHILSVDYRVDLKYGRLQAHRAFSSLPLLSGATVPLSTPSTRPSVFLNSTTTVPLFSPDWHEADAEEEPPLAPKPSPPAAGQRHPLRYLKMTQTERQITRALQNRQLYHVEKLVKRCWQTGEAIAPPIYRGLVSFYRHGNLDFLDQVVNHLLETSKDASKSKSGVSKGGNVLDLEVCNSILSAYCTHAHCYDKLLSVYATMLAQNIAPDVITFHCLLLGHATKGNTERATKTLEEMRQRQIKADIKIYTVLVTMHAKQGHSKQAWALIDTMKVEGIAPNVALYTSLLVWDASLTGETVEAHIQQIKAAMKRDGIEENVRFYNGILGLYSKFGHADRVDQVIDEIQAKKLTPNEHTILEQAYVVVSRQAADTRARLEVLAQSLVDYLESHKNLPGHNKLGPKIIRGYLQRLAAANDLKGGLEFLNFARSARLRPDEACYAIIFRVYEHQRDSTQMEHLIHTMQADGLKPSVMMFGAMVAISYELRHFREAFKWIGVMQENGYQLSANVYNKILAAVARDPAVDVARANIQTIIAAMQRDKIAPNTGFYVTMMNFELKAHNPPNALKWMKEMLAQIQPTQGDSSVLEETAFRMSLQVVAAAFGSLEQPLQMLDSYRKAGVAPTFEHYQSIALGLRQSNPALIEELFTTHMPSAEISKPYLRIYTTWIDGFASRGDCEQTVRAILFAIKACDEEKATNTDKQWIQHHLGKAVRNRRRLKQLSPPSLPMLEEWGVDLSTPTNPTTKVVFALLVALVEIMERPSAVSLLEQLNNTRKQIAVPADVVQFVSKPPSSHFHSQYRKR